MSQTEPTQTRPTGDRRAELERIKAATWPEEGKEERIARAIATFKSLPRMEIDPLLLKQIAEDPELEGFE